MKVNKRKLPLLLSFICSVQLLLAQSGFEGTLTTRVSIGGVDIGAITENINYETGNINTQLATLYKTIPADKLEKLQSMMTKNPMLGMVMMMTPPKATIHVKDKVASVKTRGIGYEIQHYHNTKSDEAFLYTTSLLRPEEEVTAFYKPSVGYEDLFTADKRITAENFNITPTTKTATVAGYPCAVSTYTAKSLAPQNNNMGIPSIALHKLVVYTSKNLPKSINFSHPYYLPEDNGIMRIDIYLDDNDEPTMVYEITSVDKKSIDDHLLTVKKSEPLYSLTDMQYGMKVLGIVMGGMSTMGPGDHDDDDNY